MESASSVGKEAPHGDPKRLLGGTLIYLAANALSAAIPFLLLPILTRALGPAQFGVVALFLMMVSGFHAFTGLCVHSAANRKAYDADPAELAVFVGSCLKIVAASTTATLVTVLLLGTPLSQLFGLELGWIFVAVVCSSASVLVNIRLGQWQTQGRAWPYALFQVWQALVLFSLALALVIALDLGAEGRMAAQGLSLATAGVVALLWLKKDDLIDFRSSATSIKAALHYGVPLVPHVFGIFLLGAVDRAIINDELGTARTGAYAAAAQCALAMAVGYDALNKALVPWLYSRLGHLDSSSRRSIVRLTYLHFVLSLLAAASLAATAWWTIPLITGPGFEEAIPAASWLFLGQAFSGMYLMVTNYIFFSGRTAVLALTTLGAGALNVTLLYWLVPTQGIEGAGIAFAISMGCRFLATWALAHRKHPMPWLSALVPTRESTPA